MSHIFSKKTKDSEWSLKTDYALKNIESKCVKSSVLNEKFVRNDYFIENSITLENLPYDATVSFLLKSDFWTNWDK